MWLAKDNVGVLDTAIRSILSTVIFAVALEGVFLPAVSMAMVGISLLLWATCVVGLCPLYSLFGLSTFPKDDVSHGDFVERH
jgi:hypothetical protein